MPIVRSGDADIFYDSVGEGEPLVWIMGLGLDSRITLMLTSAFPQYRNIIIDNRGAGQSSVPPGPYAMEQMAGDVLAVMDEAGIEKARVIGISLGGAIAQHLTLKAPERVRSLTLACTWAGPNEWIRRLNEMGTMMAAGLGFEAVLKHTLLLLFSPKYVIEQPQVVQAFEDIGRQMAAPLEPFFAQVDAAMGHDVRDRLPSIEVPTLVMSGRRDIFVPPELQSEIAALIPGSKLVSFDGGHAFMLEDPGFAVELAAFLAST